MKNSITQLYGISPEELKNDILLGVQEKLDSLKKSLEKERKPNYITRKEAATILGVTIGTINTWCKKGVLKPYRIGNRVRFKRKEIEQALENSN